LSLINVTARKQIEEEHQALLEGERAARVALERHLLLKDEFLATVSHELRTPLTAILGWTHILLGRAEAAPVAAQLAVIERNAKLQAQIVTDLLDMSRIISGKLQLDSRTVAIEKVVGAAVETVRPAAEAKGIFLGWDPRDDAAVVRGDADRLQQVFWNLLSNAVKFTPRGGRVDVSHGRTGSHVEVRVSDTGQGIEPEFLPHLFERFRQADAAIARKHGGLGLGLAIVKELVELHGGTVRAESAGRDAGASFVVALPISAVRDEPASSRTGARHTPAVESGAAVPASLRGVKVLVVDDQEDARALVGRLLAEHDAEVVTAASAMEALAALERESPDVLVSDIGMPEVDGYELIQRVRARAPEHGGAVPAVALTAFVRSEDEERARAEGYHAHLPKPIEPARLISTVSALAAGAATSQPPTDARMGLRIRRSLPTRGEA
jgi:CheY-like chemotaxis protein/nitrogen-specific signal transduction histidine kinase